MIRMICSYGVASPVLGQRSRQAFRPARRLQLLWLLAQQMTCVRHQLRYRVRFSCVVVTANIAVPIHQHHPRAVNRNALFAAAVRDGKFKTIVREFVNRALWSCKEIPAR